LKIYTKTGDKGQTGLVGGSRIDKDSLRIQAIGDVDELNAVLGVARLDSPNTSLDKDLEKLQNLLFDVGAELATPTDSKFDNRIVSEYHILYFEESIDRQTLALPPLTQFILPGGDKLAAHLHLARVVTRRAERSVLAFHKEETVRQEILVFLNRISDWLFVAARTANHERNVQDVVWARVGDT
jgi:cob(I)alamin adenosyltransferase